MVCDSPSLPGGNPIIALWIAISIKLLAILLSCLALARILAVPAVHPARLVHRAEVFLQRHLLLPRPNGGECRGDCLRVQAGSSSQTSLRHLLAGRRSDIALERLAETAREDLRLLEHLSWIGKPLLHLPTIDAFNEVA